jgi:arabinogalactan endo-1,4-beta-galactosidase
MRKNILKSCYIFALLVIALCIPQEGRSQFANGADIGWLSEMEANGYKFNNDSGIQENCLDILKEHGINALRFRVWVNPTGKYCNKKDVAYMSHRADSMGFRVMIDFHLSDWWADPGKQTKPAAWASHTVAQLDSDIYNHVYEILDTLKSVGVTPAWVQIGNETNDGMLWEDGRASTHMSNFAAMIKSGYDAVKAIDTSIQVVVHLSDGHNNTMYRWMFDGLRTNGASWDIIGMSVYPRWAGLPWHVDDSLALINMQDMISRYATKVMVVETGYYYYRPDTAKLFLTDLIAKVRSVGGLGVFYWEPECYNWQSYNMGAWDPSTKKPTVAMDAFLDTITTVVAQEAILPEVYKLDIFPNPFNPSTTLRYVLSKRSQVRLAVYNLLGQKIATLVNQEQNAGTHSVAWNAQDDHNQKVGSGVYFLKMQAGSFSQVKKMLLMK